MADNFFDQFDEQAPDAPAANFFDQFDEQPKKVSKSTAFVGPTQEQAANGVAPTAEKGFFAKLVSPLTALIPPKPDTSDPQWLAKLINSSPVGQGVAEAQAAGTNPLKWAAAPLDAVGGLVAQPAAAVVNEGTRAVRAALAGGQNDRGDMTMSDVIPQKYLPPYSAAGRALTDVATSPFYPVAKVLNASADLENPNPAVRATGHLANAAVNAISLGKAAQSLAGVKEQPEPVTAADLKARADAAYEAARASPEVMPNSEYGPLVKTVEGDLTKAGFDPDIHPMAAKALDKLYQAGTDPKVFGTNSIGTEATRRVLLNLEDSAYNDKIRGVGGAGQDYRMVNDILDNFDQMVEKSMPKASGAYDEGRAAWSTLKKTQQIEQLIQRAENNAGGQNQAGFENTLRIEFNRLRNNPRRFGSFTPAEQAAINQVADTGVFHTIMRNVGRLAPRGPVTTGLALGAAAHSGPLALAGAILAEGAKAGSTAVRSGNATAALDLVSRGGVPAPLNYAVPPGTINPSSLPALSQPWLQQLQQQQYDQQRRVP